MDSKIAKTQKRTATSSFLKHFLFLLVFISFLATCAKGFDSKNSVSINGKKYNVDAVAKEIPGRMYKLRSQYQQGLSQTFEEFAIQKIIELEAKEKGVKPEKVLFLDFQETEPTEAEISQVYEQSKSQLRGASLEEVKGEIINYLKNNRKQRHRMGKLQELKKKYKVEVQMEDLKAPRVKVAVKGNPSLGPKDAKVTIIEFSDFECPYCKRSQNVNRTLRKKYKGKIRWVFRDYPLPFHPNAMYAHMAVNCSIEQNKYWDYFNILFQNSGKLAKENVIKLAGDAGLDTEKLQACLQNEQKMKAEIQVDLEDGKKLGVNGTPAFFINGIMIEGAQPLAKFVEIIDKELKN